MKPFFKDCQMHLYYDKQLDYFKTNTKRTWQILNEVINRKKRTNKLTTTFVSNDKKISSPNEVILRIFY